MGKDSGNTFYFQMDRNEKYELKSGEEYKRISKSTYKAAVGFYIISQKCMDMIISEYSNQICSNIAFSCELFLKSILFKNEIDCRSEHDLFKLYNLLPQKDREAIKKKHLCGNINRESFDINLKEVGKSFVVLRYSYERKRMAYNLQFLLELLMALDDYCIDIFENNN